MITASQHWFVRAALAPLVLVALVDTAQATLVISKAPTSNVTCNAGNCVATAEDAVMNVKKLRHLLATTDVTLSNTNFSQAPVLFDAALSWSSSHQLTVQSNWIITVARPIVVEGAATIMLVGHGELATTSVMFTGAGKLDLWDPGARFGTRIGFFTLVSDFPSLVAAAIANPGGTFALTKDYDDKSDVTYSAPPLKDFDGVLEGLGHTVSHVRINSAEQFVGLMGRSYNGAISNLTLGKLSVRAKAQPDNAISYVGGLAGYSQGTAFNVHVNGKISGGDNSWTGGLFGTSFGYIYNCGGNATVSGGAASLIGGLVGRVQNGLLRNNETAGVVNGGTVSTASGGLVGQLEGLVASINRSSASVSGGAYAGGLVGQLKYVERGLDQAYATGAVSSHQSGGGLVGDNIGSITNAYASGSVTAPYAAGGLVGQNEGAIATSYAAGIVGTAAFQGGLIGQDLYQHLTNTYWDQDTSGIGDASRGAGNPSNDPGITGLSDVQLKAALPPGFDPGTWGQSAAINSGYPYLIANPPPQ